VRHPPGRASSTSCGSTMTPPLRISIQAYSCSRHIVGCGHAVWCRMMVMHTHAASTSTVGDRRARVDERALRSWTMCDPSIAMRMRTMWTTDHSIQRDRIHAWGWRAESGARPLTQEGDRRGEFTVVPTHARCSRTKEVHSHDRTPWSYAACVIACERVNRARSRWLCVVGWFESAK
jgi:hypothetical protein